jgi:hypothetical protein
MKVLPSIIDDTMNIDVSYDDKANKIYFYQRGLEVRFATAAPDMVKDYPNFNVFIHKQYDLACKVDKKLLLNRLLTSMMVNKTFALFALENNLLYIHTISESGYAPNTATVPVESLTLNGRYVWALQHLADLLKAVSGETITLSIPKDKSSVKIMDLSDGNYMFLTLFVNLPLYKNAITNFSAESDKNE